MDVLNLDLPDSYKQFMNSRDEMVDLYYEFSRKKPKTLKKEYGIWCSFMLEQYSFSDKVPNYKILSDKEHYFKDIEGFTTGINIELVKKSFAFGLASSEGGILFFHPENFSIWEIYPDLYINFLADTFDEFITNAKFCRKWDHKNCSLHSVEYLLQF